VFRRRQTVSQKNGRSDQKETNERRTSNVQRSTSKTELCQSKKILNNKRRKPLVCAIESARRNSMFNIQSVNWPEDVKFHTRHQMSPFAFQASDFA